jgi:hypothetical protein
VLTKTVAHSTALIATGGATVADTAQGTTPEQQSYTVGDNHCFAAASSPTSDSSTATIAISAPSRVRTSDLEVVNATLTDSEGKPLAGKRVTAVVGAGTAVAGTTNSAGQVRLSPRVVDRAGTRVLSVRYAGDASSKTETRKPLTLLAEVSKISTGSSGTGPTHTFTMTLTDDDAPRHPYAGAKLTVGYSGKTVTVTTDRSGRATLKLKPGTHIDVRYGGKSGFVLPATARTVVR